MSGNTVIIFMIPIYCMLMTPQNEEVLEEAEQVTIAVTAMYKIKMHYSLSIPCEQCSTAVSIFFASCSLALFLLERNESALKMT